MFRNGSFWFGLVIGFITYRTLRRTTSNGISDIASVTAAIGGGAVLQLFQPGSEDFDHYAIGLSIGFFLYLAISLLLAYRSGEGGEGRRSTDREFLGDA